jgi:redox-sensitive bicupin YhaK (pirin superfamily)
MTVTVRPSAERGHFDHGWLDTFHSFSFAEYMDPRHMGFRGLRVINEDRIAGGGGFPTHGHRDMEIITYMVSGSLAHRDSTGAAEEVRRGEIQRMTAGSGIRHSEFNASRDEAAHLLQIWIIPQSPNLEPGYEQRAFPPEQRRNALKRLAGHSNGDGALLIHADAEVYGAFLDAGASVEHSLRPGRGAWLQVVSGAATVNGVAVAAGDGAAIEKEPAAIIRAKTETELLLFDLG